MSRIRKKQKATAITKTVANESCDLMFAGHGHFGKFFSSTFGAKQVPVEVPTIVFKDRNISELIYGKKCHLSLDCGVIDLGDGYGAIVWDINYGTGYWAQDTSCLRQYHVSEDFSITELEAVELIVDTEKFTCGSGAHVTHHSMLLARELPVKSSFYEEAGDLVVFLEKHERKTGRFISSRNVTIKVPRG